MVSSLESCRPDLAALIGSMSPTMSAIVTSGGGEFFDVTRVTSQPRDRRLVAVRCKACAACTADRIQRVVVDLAGRGITGISSSSSVTSARSRRVFA
jgi:hypothetical protein